MGLTRITFAGIDESCSVEQLLALAQCEPRLEYAILYQPPQVKPRYPAENWIVQTAMRLHGARVPLALHVCKEAVANMLASDSLDAFAGWTFFERIQLNAKIPGKAEESLMALIDRLAPVKVITQQPVNPDLHLRTGRPTHQVVFDGSLGRGILPDAWPEALVGCDCGYSGGLGPDTMAKALPCIFKAAGRAAFWIDMESGLRAEHNVFSFDRARATLSRIAEVERRVKEEGAL